MLGLFALAFGQAGATIVGGVRQKPVPETTGFATDTEAYLYNVGAQAFFTQGNSWGTQASIGETGLLMKFTSASSSDVYYLENYFCDVNGNQSYSWKYAFFDSDTQMYVDWASWKPVDYYWEMEDNGDGTFRLMASDDNENITKLPGFYMGLNVAENASNTALSPAIKPATGHYIDWALVTPDEYDAVLVELTVYEKAQELKALIDNIKAQNGDASSAEAVYLDESSTIAQIEAAIEDAHVAYVQALIDNAPDKNNVDVTTLLVNPAYEEGTNGWTVQAASGGNVAVAGLPTNKCFEAWNNSSFDIYQTVSNAPVGVYEIEVQGFYRYLRDANAWKAYKAQQVDYVKPQGVPVYVYMNNNSTPFKNIYSEPVPKNTLYTTDASLLYPGNLPPCEDDLGNWYPNEMYNSAVAFNAGMYKQSAFGLVAQDGDLLRIGVKGASNQGNDSWVIWDNFKLVYRGFKADVIKPVLETAVNEVKVYENMPMGKTEYAALTKGLADAAAAIEANNGEAMFAALNDLYNVKGAVQVSKDLFAANEVSGAINHLSESIEGVAGNKLSATTLANANALLTGLKNNTIYENADVNNIGTDVSQQVTAINTSVLLYQDLYNAIEALNAELSKKAAQNILDEATALSANTTTAYNEGSIEDADVQAKIDELNAEKNKVTASAELYAQFYAAIGRLQDAVDEASAQSAHVSQAVLEVAQLRLGTYNTEYTNGTLTDDKIEGRIRNIDNLIANLTKSIELYKSLNTAIEELKAAIEATEGKHLNAAVLADANLALQNATDGYNAGSYSDEQIEPLVNELRQNKEAINQSIEQYELLVTPLDNLNNVKDNKANKDVTANANQLYTETLDAYNNGTIADTDIPAKVTEINETIDLVNASADKYAQFYAAIGRLEDAINDVSGETAHVSQAALDLANARLTSYQNQYNNGTVTDANIDNRIANIESIIESLTASVNLYRNFAAAINDLKDEIDAMESQKLSSATLGSANALYGYAKNDYDNGTVADEQVEARIAELRAMIETLRNSAAGYVSLADAIESLENCITQAKQDNALSQTKVPQSVIDDAENLLNTTKADYEAGNVADANVAAVISSLEAMEHQLDEAVEVAQVTVTIGETGYATFFSAQPVSFVGTELKAFTATFNSDYSSVKLDEVTEIPANTPVIVQGAKGAYQLNIATAPATPDSNDLIVVEAGGSYATLFVLANKSLGVGFYKWTGTDLPVSKVALNVPAAARDFIGLEGDVTTGIMSAAWLNASGMTIYDLQGHKVDQVVKKGLYIVNGRKVVVK